MTCICGGKPLSSILCQIPKPLTKSQGCFKMLMSNSNRIEQYYGVFQEMVKIIWSYAAYSLTK